MLKFLFNFVITCVAVVLGGQRESDYVDEGFVEVPDWDTGGMVFRTHGDGTWSGTR